MFVLKNIGMLFFKLLLLLLISFEYGLQVLFSFLLVVFEKLSNSEPWSNRILNFFA